MVDIKVKDAKVKNGLDRVRAATQELHGAISDAAAKRGADMKADLQAVPGKAKAVTDSIKSSMGEQNEVAKKHLAEAVTNLDATQKHINESLKTSGQAFQSSVSQALASARAAVQKVSEAVAAQRSEHPEMVAGVGALLVGGAIAAAAVHSSKQTAKN